MTTDNLPTLGYWNIRGLAEPIRLVLHYAGIPFNDKRYPFGATLETAREHWFKEKFALGLDFPNLPYWIEGDLKISQSTAVLRHVARKAKLVGENETEQAHLEMLEQQAADLRMALINVAKEKEKFHELRPEFVKSLPEKLKPWSDYLGERKFLLGDKVKYVDFLLADILSIYVTFEPTALNGFSSLTNYLERVESLPGVAEYLEGGVYKKLPYAGPFVHPDSKLF